MFGNILLYEHLMIEQSREWQKAIEQRHFLAVQQQTPRRRCTLRSSWGLLKRTWNTICHATGTLLPCRMP